MAAQSPEIKVERYTVSSRTSGVWSEHYDFIEACRSSNAAARQGLEVSIFRESDGATWVAGVARWIPMTY